MSFIDVATSFSRRLTAAAMSVSCLFSDMHADFMPIIGVGLAPGSRAATCGIPQLRNPALFYVRSHAFHAALF